MCVRIQYVHIQYVRIQYVRIQYVRIQYVRIQYVRIQYVRIQYVRIQYLRIQYCTSIPSTPVLFVDIAPLKEPIPVLWSRKHQWGRPAQQGNRVRGHRKELGLMMGV